MANDILNFFQTVQGGIPNGTVVVSSTPNVDDMIIWQLKSGSSTEYEWAAIGLTALKTKLNIPDNITNQGNTFNGANQLVKLDSTSKLPAVDGSKLTNLTLPSNVTIQGNTFNGANQLVKLDSGGKLPAVDGSQLTNLPGGGGGVSIEEVVVEAMLY